MQLIARQSNPLVKPGHDSIGHNIFPPYPRAKQIGFNLVSIAICLCIPTFIVFAQRNARPENVLPSPPEQVVSKPRKKDVRKEKVELSNEQQQALLLLENIGDRANKLEGSILKVRVIAKVADSLWQFNELHARRLFTEAFDAIDSIKLDPSKDQRMRIAVAAGGPGPLGDLRAEVLRTVAAHDFRLAESLRESIKEPKADASTGKGSSELSEKEELAWDVAIASAKLQPQRTAQFVRSQLRMGINEELGWALVDIRRNNQQLAQQLFSESVAAARLNLNSPENVEILAVYVLPGEAEALHGQVPDLMRDAASREFLAYTTERLLWLSASGHPSPRGAEAQQEQRTLQSLVPLFERLMPDKVALVRERMDVLLSNMTTRQANAALSKHEDIAELLQQAESIVGSEKRDRRLVQVSMIAVRQGELEQALSIADKISDLADRSIQVSLISYQASLKLLKNGELEDAYQYARRIEFWPQRIAAFIALANKLRASKEDARARVILEEISQWTEKTDNTPQKAKALLSLAIEMAQFDGERSFALLASAIKTINSVDFSSPQSTEPSRVLQVTLDMLDLQAVFDKVTQLNMDRALQAAQALTHREASLLAQAVVCSQILASNRGLHKQKSAPN